MLRTIIAVLVAISFANLDSAEAASKGKRQKVRAIPPVLTTPVARTPGPIWAGPGECYTDEGYGRYWPCGQGRDR